MKTKSYFLLFILLFIFASLSGQVVINNDGSSADAQAMLDIQSSDMGILVPRINITDLYTEAPLSAPIASGMLVYNTNTSSGEGFHYWNGSAWIKMVKSSSPGGIARIFMGAEYAGASVVPDGSFNSGYLTSGNAGSSANFMNYYNWVSGQTSLQDYDIYLRVEIPENFLSWDGDAILVEFQTDNAAVSENACELVVYEESSGTPLATISQTASTTWAPMTIPSTSLGDLTAGETALIKITLYSQNGNAARVGDVILQYNY